MKNDIGTEHITRVLEGTPECLTLFISTGGPDIRTNGCLWRQYECNKEHSMSGIDIEEEVELNLLPRITRIGRNE